MQFTIAVAMTDPTQYTELARTAEECGFAQIAVPDSAFWSEQVSDAYPYTGDGSRMWTQDTPFVDPFMAVAAMAAVTSRLRLCTHVVKVGTRNPLLLAKQVATAAVLSGDRFTFGAGVGWLREEFEWCGQSYEGRGKRVDETLEAIAQVLTGGWTSYQGEQVSFGRLRMAPAPRQPVPVYVGGHTGPALRRAVRFGSGWTTAMIGFEEFRTLHEDLMARLRAADRNPEEFAFQVASADRFGLEGYRELAAAGATDLVTVPWLFYGVPLDGELAAKQDGIRQFAAEVIDKW